MSTNSSHIEQELTPASAGSTVAKTRRYHPALVVMHWVIAILIFGAFFLVQRNEGGDRGRFQPGNQNFPPPQNFQQDDEDSGPPPGFQPGIVHPGQDSQPGNTSGDGVPQNRFPQDEGNQSIFSTIGIHMIFGLTILVLLMVRLIMRWTTKHPEWASAGNKFFDWIGSWTHFGLYLLSFAMVITGIILADQRGQLARTFGIGSAPVRGSFGGGGFSLGMFHGAIWTLLLLLILLHVVAALYHQFYLKDNLMGRMWFGKRDE